MIGQFIGNVVGGLMNLLVKGIFAVIMALAGLIVSPIISFLTLLIPDLGNAIEYALNIFNRFLLFVPIALDFLMIPRGAVAMFFDFYILMFSLFVFSSTFLFILRMYNKFKF